jgi:threonine dehydratase
MEYLDAQKPHWRCVIGPTMRPMIDLQTIQQAAERLRGQVLLTPCVESRTLSEIVRAQVFLKFENLQFTASFKERGACNKLAQLSEAERARGVVAMSAGNHAQAWPTTHNAWACERSLSCRASRPG